MAQRSMLAIRGDCYMNKNYPNLMCFGNDFDKCGGEKDCPDYCACREKWAQQLALDLSFIPEPVIDKFNELGCTSFRMSSTELSRVMAKEV